ncbi:MAG: polysaccharide pyruvyl transferase family protein [Oscillospiraceae bacterium]
MDKFMYDSFFKASGNHTYQNNEVYQMIYILSVYDSMNYGSYFQAYSLFHILKKYDKTAFLDVHHQCVLKQAIKSVCGHIYHRRVSGIGFELKKFKLFSDERKKLCIVPQKSAEENATYVLGSDEIWNIRRKKFQKTPAFFGIGLKGSKKISYAPSVNNSSENDFIHHTELIAAIKELDAITVRDRHSQTLIAALTGREAMVVADPTFLFMIEGFRKLQQPINRKAGYIMIYTYGKMFKIPDMIDRMKRIAAKKRLHLISVGNKYLDWCDENVAVMPGAFLSYVDQADYIITDTFHGTVFSLLYQKKFVVVNGTNKTSDLLHSCRLESNNITAVTQLEEVMDQQIDYVQCGKYLKDIVERSFLFLNEQFAKEEDKK